MERHPIRPLPPIRMGHRTIRGPLTAEASIQRQPTKATRTWGGGGFPPGYPGNANGSPVSPLSALQSLQYGALGPQSVPSPGVPQGVLSNVPPGNLEEQNLSGTQVPTNEEAVSFVQAAQQLSIEPIVLANFLLEHVVILSGAVRGPGVYFAGPALTLDTLIAAAGGASNWADESTIDVISTGVERSTGIASTTQGTIRFAEAANYRIRPRDEFRIHEVYADAGTGSVTLQGEFRHVGTYHITRGEHLSQLLAQAGGLKPMSLIRMARFSCAVQLRAWKHRAISVQPMKCRMQLIMSAL